ncbi:glycosyltransferase family 4 protein [Microbaculum marinisediminis]|uniref:Glycosyltransferase family 4 protein n=1 Tax=Microbaculum marinisediminis TaxID=2931392 RepID=A0AAW5QWG7_9HYPH|nr:glycosyltransferase family 4 protein [Microbaculum sp. A6E488]MCT8972063.1 glycosyltransferase family 4 protein [Microbaculum sp. A6E488]
MTGPSDTMRLAVVLPRNMHYAPDRATSIDLCARDFVLHSRFRDGITVIGGKVKWPFTDVPYIGVEDIDKAFGPFSFAPVRAAIERANPDVILVHQYPPAAARIQAGLPRIPVVLQRHNMQPRRWVGHRLWRDRFYRNLAGVIFVSEAARASYTGRASSAVVYNGIDTRTFVPAGEKEPIVLFAGRAVPEKGVEPFAEAATMALQDRPGWRAVLALGGGKAAEATVARVRHHLGPLGARAEILADLPHPDVMDLFARAAIAVVPSVWAEPFGRTALEAMTSGAAVITSGRGGLSEVVGDTAIVTGSVEPADFAAAIARLIDDDAERQRLQAAGRDRAVHFFDIRTVTASFDDLLAGVGGLDPDAHVPAAMRVPAGEGPLW